MAGELRSLSFVVELIDRATKPLQNIMSLGESLDKTGIEIAVEATGTEAAASSFYKLQGGLEKLSDAGNRMGEQLGKAGEKVAEAGAKVQQVWNPASQSFDQVAEAGQKAAAGIEKVTQKMGPLQSAATRVSSAVDNFKGKLLGIEAAASVFVYSSISAAAEVERLENTVKAGFGEGAEGILKWAEAGGKLTGVTNESRMAMALLFQQAKMGNEQIMTSTELVEKYWKNKALRGKLQTAGIGSKEALAEQIKNVEIGGGRAFGLKQIWGKDALDDVIQNGHGAKKVLTLMQKDLEKTADTSDDTLSAQADLSEAWGEFTENAGKGLLGPMTFIFKKLTQLIQLIDSIPGGATVAGLGAGLTFVAVSAVFLAGMLANAVLSIQALIGAGTLATMMTRSFALANYLAAGASGVLSGAVGVLTGALQVMKVAMLGNPLTAAFVILLGVLILLETKFHIFSNLFKSLEKVDWAGKWASSVEYLTGLWDGLIDRVSWLKGLVSGGLGALSKIGGGNVAVGGLMVAIPGIGIMIGLLKLLHGTIKTLLDMTGFSTQSLRDIYNEIRKQFDKALSFLGSLIPDWLKNLTAGIDGFYNWLKTSWGKLLKVFGIRKKEEEVIGTLPEAESGPMTDEQKKAMLHQNATEYAIQQAAGSAFGMPAIGAGDLEGWQAAFGGKFKDQTFASSRYEGEHRSGRDLTEEQLLTGEWTPNTGGSEFFKFVESERAARAKEAESEGGKRPAAKEEEYTSVFDDVIKWLKDIYQIIADFYRGVLQKLGIEKPIEGEELRQSLYNFIENKPDTRTLAQSQKDWLVKYALGEDLGGQNATEISRPYATSITDLQKRDMRQLAEDLRSGKASAPPRPTTSSPDNLLSAKSPQEIASSIRVSPISGEPEIPLREKTPEERLREASSGSTTALQETLPLLPPVAGKAPAPAEREKGLGEKVYDSLMRLSNYVPSFDTGGAVTETGIATVHEGEEVANKEQVGVIAGLMDTIEQVKSTGPTAQTVIRQGDKTVNMYGPFVTIGKIDSRIDIDRMQNDLIKFLRAEIKSAIKG